MAGAVGAAFRMSFTTTTVHLGFKRVQVACTNQMQYGHLGLEIKMSLARARQSRADVYLVRAATSLGSGLFELESPEVRVLRPTGVVQRLLAGCASLQHIRDRLHEWRGGVVEQVEREFVHEVSRYVDDNAVPQPVRERLRGARRRVRASLEHAEQERFHRMTYYERRLLRDPIPVRLHPAAAEEAERQARAHGLAPGAPLVCIHAREAGYKKGRELRDRKPQDSRDDGVRNARIESYFGAVDRLVERGYTVVRLGDASMTPVRRAGVVDLATSPDRTNLLEIYCLLRSAFIVAGESAYVGIVCVTNTPLVLVNVTEPISGYPIRAPGLFLPKTVIDRRDGRRLSAADLLGVEYQRQLRDTRRYRYVDNTADEILGATCEMLEWLGGGWAESAGQRRYHQATVAAAAQLRRRSAYVRKWGLHRGFLGDGRIARVALAANGDAPIPGTPGRQADGASP